MGLTDRQMTFGANDRLVLWRLEQIESLLDSALGILSEDHPAYAMIVGMRGGARSVVDAIDATYPEEAKR